MRVKGVLSLDTLYGRAALAPPGGGHSLIDGGEIGAGEPVALPSAGLAR